MKASSGHFAALRGKCKDLGSIPSYGSGGIMKSPAHKESANEKPQSVANVADNVVTNASFSLVSARSANRLKRSGQWVSRQTSHKTPFRFSDQTSP